MRENLEANEAQARSNLQMMELVRDAPVEGDIAELMVRQPIDAAKLKELFDFLEFHSLAKRFDAAFGEQTEGFSAEADDVATRDANVTAIPSVAAAIDQLGAIASHPRPAGLAAGYDGAALSVSPWWPMPRKGHVIWLTSDLLDDAGVHDALRSFGAGAGFVSHHAKPILRSLLRRGLDLTGALRNDTAVGEYLLEPASGATEIMELVRRYAGVAFPVAGEVEPGQLDFGAAAVDPSLVAARRVGRRASRFADGRCVGGRTV
ncbi:MAG: hypothetical protein R2706_18850 [Acidimicrobiales bacterium]